MKKRLLLGVLVIFILGGIGGKIYMDKREEDRQELLEIQKDLANYMYNNYRLYINNTEEYVEKVVSVRKYIDTGGIN
uniref:hypothetical protein n=1 Tax=Enterococcus mundtii TaxID=53346 RepID=UPI0021B0F6C0|nr:hypothetical protein [Enterococcus mundtii]